MVIYELIFNYEMQCVRTFKNKIYLLITHWFAYKKIQLYCVFLDICTEITFSLIKMHRKYFNRITNAKIIEEYSTRKRNFAQTELIAFKIEEK